jgi:hypothetical protein
MTLAALSEPGGTITGTLLARLGAAETVQLITSDVRLPKGVGPAEGELWRRRLAPRINPGQVDRILTDMERHDLRVLTPDDIDCPGPVTSPASAGCHRLIQEGVASLVIYAQDVIGLLDSTADFSGDRTFAYSPTKRFTRPGPSLN